MLLEISAIIIAAFIVILIIVLIPVLIKIFKAAKQAEKLFETVKNHVPSISHDLAIILHDASDISASANRQVAKIEGSIDKYKRIESIFEQKIARPFMEIIATLSGLLKGLAVFIKYLKRVY